MKRAVCLALAFGFFATPVFATQNGLHGDHAQEAQLQKKQCNCGAPSSKAYKKAIHKMHKSMEIKYTGDFDTDFTRGMVPHHQGAVGMAEVVLKYGQDKEISDLAKRIILAQKQEIAMMNHWLNTRASNSCGKNSESEKEFEDVMKKMHQNMHITYTGDADVDFARGMIPHHQGAIEMADILIEKGDDPALLKLARDIIRSQSQEVETMQEWLDKNSPQAVNL